MSGAAGRLQAVFLSRAEFATRPPDWRAGVLGGAVYARPGARPEAADLALIDVDTPPLDGRDSVCEIWRDDGAVRAGTAGAIRYRCSDALLFGTLSLDPNHREPASGTPLQGATEAGYRAIFKLLAELDYPYVLRFWNYFPEINRETHGIERYRQFNIGRQDAFIAGGRSVSANVPAACALGAHSGVLSIAFIATRVAPRDIENPRQVSAYHYPGEYGPRSPTFSRASLIDTGAGAMLFISGTASIVGHKSLHFGDVRAQTRESLANIAAVVEEANRTCGSRFNLGALCYKVYVRHAADYAAVRDEFERIVGPAVRAIYLHADVCRAELLVEIEASGGHPCELTATAAAG